MNKRKILILLTFIMTIVCLMMFSHSCKKDENNNVVTILLENFNEQEKVWIEGWTTANVNVRVKPSLDSDILEVFSIGEPISYYKYNDEWVAINYEEKNTAFINSKYVTEDSVLIDYLMFVNKLEIATSEDTFLEYKEFINKHSDKYDLPETIYDYYTEQEIETMLQCIETETHGQDFLSKVNVANVVLNRIISEEFSESPIDVITSPNQFAYHREEIEESTINALEYAFLFEDTTQGALYFHSNEKTETFNGASYIFTDLAGHHFYK